MAINKNIFIKIFVFVFIFYSTAGLFGFNQFFAFFMILSSLVIYFLLEKKLLLNKKIVIPFIIICITVFIDKYINYINTIDIKHIVSFSFIIIYTYFLFHIAKSKFLSHKIWNYILYSLIITLIASVLYHMLVGVVAYESMDRDISMFLLLIMMILYFKNKIVYFTLLIPTIFFLYYITTSRTHLFALFIFFVTSFLITKKTKTKNLLFYLTLAILLTILIIYIAIYYEYTILHGTSNDFTGRGLIWFYSIDYLVSNNLFIFGSSSDALSMKANYSNLYVSDLSNGIGLNRILQNGQFHNTFVSLFYNTGLVGASMFIYLLYYMVRKKLIPYQNIIMLFILMFTSSFMGQPYYGFTYQGLLFLVVLIVPFIDKQKINLGEKNV